MVPDLMPLADRAPENLRMVRRVLPDDKKCRFEMMGREEIQQFRSERGIGTIVEGESDVRAFDVDGIKRDLGLRGRGRGYGRTRTRNRWNRSGALPGSHLRKQETEREINKQPSSEHLMTKNESRKLSLYLAEATCNARHGAARFFRDKWHLVAVILLQTVATNYSA